MKFCGTKFLWPPDHRCGPNGEELSNPREPFRPITSSFCNCALQHPIGWVSALSSSPHAFHTEASVGQKHKLSSSNSVQPQVSQCEVTFALGQVAHPSGLALLVKSDWVGRPLTAQGNLGAPVLNFPTFQMLQYRSKQN